MKKSFGILNALWLAAMCVGTYCYFTVDDLPMKAICSGGFALLGILNLIYAFKTKAAIKFAAVMASGLIVAMLGDIAIDRNFIVGAALFAGGHICYFCGQCTLIKGGRTDLIAASALFAATASFLLFCPLLAFPDAVMQGVCIGYALLISLMTGKSISNFLRCKNRLTAILAAGCVLFFFSDLMLVLDWFTEAGRITGILCMSTYYPAEYLLAFSIYGAATEQKTKALRFISKT